VRRAAPKTARRATAVADASMIGRVVFGHMHYVTDIDTLVTDASAGVDVHRA
jgi:DeoR/GlpR family transcriptional regulator of sugar metabolism